MKSVAEQLKEWGACADGYKWAVGNCKTMAEVWDKCGRGDWLIWLLRQNGWESRLENVQVAVACAEHVLPIFEKQHPEDKRPRQAIEAAKAWLDNPCEATRQTAAVAASAYAASAADAYAADAYAAAAASAAAAADDGQSTERRWQAEAIRKIVSNPWKGCEQ